MNIPRFSRRILLLFVSTTIVSAQSLYVPSGSIGTSGNGNVGVGTAAPQNKFTVQTTSGGTGFGGTDGTGGARVAWTTGYGVSLDAWDGSTPRWGIVKFSANSPTVMIEGKYNNNDVIFNGGGNVGIGTTTPATRLMIDSAAGSVPAAGLLRVGSTDYSAQANKTMLSIAPGIVDVDAPGVPGGRLRIDGVGSVGIGIPSPAAKLHIYQASGGYDQLRLDTGFGGGNAFAVNPFITGISNGGFEIRDVSNNIARIVVQQSTGNVGIGTALPGVKLSIADNQAAAPAEILLYNLNNAGSRNVDLRLGNGSGQASVYLNNATLALGFGFGIPTGGLSYKDPGNYPGSDTLTLSTASGGNIVFSPNGTGNVGIDTTNPTQKLSVNGSIRAHEVIVDTGWSDYVFADDYALAPLSEVEAHIKAHHSLPGVPSEAQVAKEGMSVGEMQAKLLAKIEELTLHVIQQEKQHQDLASRVRQLESENQQLRAHLSP
jgi:hypothetical protein